MSALKDAPDGQVELITHSTEEACDSDGIQSRQVWFIRERLWILRTYCYTRARLSCKRSTCLTRVWTLKFGPALNVVSTSTCGLSHYSILACLLPPALNTMICLFLPAP
jgi:hypothetical protein